MTLKKKLTRILCAAAISAALFMPQTASAYSRTDFNISFNNITSDLKIMSTTVLPGAHLDVMSDGKAAARSGRLAQLGNGGWRWTAPKEPGLSILTFTKGGETIQLNVFVLSEWKNGVEKDFNGYTVGKYVKDSKRGPSYEAPKGFIETNPICGMCVFRPALRWGNSCANSSPGTKPPPC